ncbi:serum amyloid P-component-like [Alosa alosa]|uniref:serum amyloid P-component-like n=1 Tax=Alosa alosa TaxID=278164 RepID=UPI00201509CD|nr:serum amyloid P-component-like [Alosa alosa]
MCLSSLTVSFADTGDLSGKVFTFPEKGSTAYVRLTPSSTKILYSATFCLRLRMFVNWIHSVKKSLKAGGSIAGTSIILGQHQGSYGERFESSQAFVGQIKDVHMWDHVISTCAIKSYMQGLVHSHGNNLSWTKLGFSIHGQVLLED